VPHAWGFLAAAALAGCAGTAPVATPFTRGAVNFDQVPETALREAAVEIEREVYAANREPALTDREGLIVNTPEIQQAVRTRAARIELVNAMLDAGFAWERPNGRLWILRTQEYKKATTSRRRDIDAIMVNGENRDRWIIYEELVDANKLSRNGLSAVQQIFFEERRAFMKPGQLYEGETGEPTAIP
jgi:hypothetical protein